MRFVIVSAFSVLITSLGEEESGPCVSRAIVCLQVVVCPFPLPHTQQAHDSTSIRCHFNVTCQQGSVEGGLRFVIVAYPRTSINFFRTSFNRLRIHMKTQALFFSKDKSKNNKSVVCCNLG